jgi:K+-sensing histidine kinase KdpD
VEMAKKTKSKKKKGGFLLGALIGLGAGAASVFLSNKDNREKVGRAADKAKTEAKKYSDKSQGVEDEIMWMRRIISHNVRMPMAIIKGYGDVLKQDLLGEKERQKAIDSIYENILYLDQILSVVFDYGETKEVTLVKVNICEVIRKVIGYVKEISRNNGIKSISSCNSQRILLSLTRRIRRSRHWNFLHFKKI